MTPLGLRHRTVGHVSLITPWFDVDTAAVNLARTREALAGRYRVVGPEHPLVDRGAVTAAIDGLARERISALIIELGTFPDGEAPPDLAQALGVPVVVLSRPEPDPRAAISLNSLCGANLTTYTLSALDCPHLAVHGDPAHADCAERLHAALDAALAVGLLADMRLGLIGSRAPGFYPCAFDELLLRRRLGVTIEHIGLQEVTAGLDGGARRDGPRELIGFDGESVSGDDRAAMERSYGALADVLEAHPECSPVAVKDWPELWGMWPALGWLADDGHVLGPEGDVHGALGMALQRQLAGATPMLADISAFDPADSTLTLWHYGGAPSLAADPAAVRYQPADGNVQFTLAPGPGTLLRIGLRGGDLRMLTVGVDVLDEPLALGRAAALARPRDASAETVVGTLLDDGWEHHVSYVPGDVRAPLAGLARLLSMPLTAL